MMTIKQIEVTVGEITQGYINNEEQGVRGYNGMLDIRPPYQREFIYSEKEQKAVITTVLKGYPLSSMYWVKRSEDAECMYEVMDGQQRTLSLCEYVAGKFSYDFKNFFNQPEDIQKKILDYPLTVYVCEGEASEKLERAIPFFVYQIFGLLISRCGPKQRGVLLFSPSAILATESSFT